MDVQLKKVKFHEELSEETNCFTANIYYKGRLCGYAKNNGQGGCTDIKPYPEKRELFEQCEKYCKTLPDFVHESIFGTDDNLVIKANIESVVDNLFVEWAENQQEKKIEKLCEKGIVIKKGNTYNLFEYKHFTIERMLSKPEWKLQLLNDVRRLKKEGKEIVNKNIPEI